MKWPISKHLLPHGTIFLAMEKLLVVTSISSKTSEKLPSRSSSAFGSSKASVQLEACHLYKRPHTNEGQGVPRVHAQDGAQEALLALKL